LLPFLLLLPSHNRSVSLLTEDDKRRLCAILLASTYFADAKHAQYVHKTNKTKQKGLGFRVSRKTLNPSAMIRVLSHFRACFLASLLCLRLFLSLSRIFSFGFFSVSEFLMYRLFKREELGPLFLGRFRRFLCELFSL
jgi:hypothetical protein